MIPLLVVGALYLVTTLLYLWQMVRGRDGWRLPSLMLQGTFLAHALALPLWIGAAGPERIARLSFALPVVAWILAAVYLILEARFKLQILGTLVLPLLTIAVFSCLAVEPGLAPVTSPLQDVLLSLHVLGAVLGLAAFGLASGLAGLYLLQERQLKAKRFGGGLYRKLPSLDTTDRLTFRVIGVGFALYTVGVVLGALRAHERGGFGTMGIAYLPAVVSWLLYALVLQGRLWAGWRGRKAAVLVLSGFAASALVLLKFLVL